MDTFWCDICFGSVVTSSCDKNVDTSVCLPRAIPRVTRNRNRPIRKPTRDRNLLDPGKKEKRKTKTLEILLAC